MKKFETTLNIIVGIATVVQILSQIGDVFK